MTTGAPAARAVAASRSKSAAAAHLTSTFSSAPHLVGAVGATPSSALREFQGSIPARVLARPPPIPMLSSVPLAIWMPSSMLALRRLRSSRPTSSSAPASLRARRIPSCSTEAAAAEAAAMAAWGDCLAASDVSSGRPAVPSGREPLTTAASHDPPLRSRAASAALPEWNLLPPRANRRRACPRRGRAASCSRDRLPS